MNTYKFNLPLTCKVSTAKPGFITWLGDWRYVGTDGVNEAEGGYGGLSYPIPDVLDPDFIPFSDLTEADIIAWVEKDVGEKQIAAMQKAIDAKLAEMANPTTENVPAPWASEPA